jgi:pimeloyl-ACP methyl ester carboxylesterase
MQRYLPAEWERVRDGVADAERGGDLAAACARLLAHRDPDVRERAAREWCAWEERHVTATTAPRPDPRFADPAFRMRFARLVTHYWSHATWLGEDELVRGAGRLAAIPAVLVHGRAGLSSPPEFAHRLHRAWPGSELVLVDGASHGADARPQDGASALRNPRPRHGAADISTYGGRAPGQPAGRVQSDSVVAPHPSNRVFPGRPGRARASRSTGGRGWMGVSRG